MELLSEEANDASSHRKNRRTLWDVYRAFVHQNHVSLELLDAGLSRILFWAPTTSDGAEQRHRQREVLYGILSLHRLAMDTALQQEEDADDKESFPQDFGMTVRPNPEPATSRSACPSQESESPNDTISLLTNLVSPSTIRITLTVLQSLLPSILEISRSSSITPQDNDQRQRQARLYVERIKFTLRLTLLGYYWRRMKRQQQHRTEAPLSLGIMTEGGLFHGIHNNLKHITTVSQEEALWKRRTYVGRRTGRTVVQPTPKGGNNTAAESLRNPSSRLLVVIGEILYAYRSLYWANAEAKGSASYCNWLIAIAMDLISLQCFRMNSNSAMPNNSATETELSRRKMRLLLYLLRTPVWDRFTEPTSDRTEDLMDQVPVLGRLASTYLRDWLWYMKHPYEAEQG